MRMRMRRAAVFVLAMAPIVTVAQQPPAFDVASIKRNASGEFAGDVRQSPDGSLTTVNVPLRYFLGLAWPSDDSQYRDLPGWAGTNRYDVAVKPPAGASPAQIKEMWRTLLKDRFKLQAHDEMRDTPIYALVVARDGALGPQLKRSPHNCAAAPPAPLRPTMPPDAEIMAGCESSFFPGKMISGGTLISTFAQTLGRGLAGRLVDDRTGLEGYYALTLTWTPASRTTADVPSAPGDLPSIFTALQEQLGLRLEPARKPIQTVVIDHIEPPTEN